MNIIRPECYVKFSHPEGWKPPKPYNPELEMLKTCALAGLCGFCFSLAMSLAT